MIRPRYIGITTDHARSVNYIDFACSGFEMSLMAIMPFYFVQALDIHDHLGYLYGVLAALDGIWDLIVYPVVIRVYNKHEVGYEGVAMSRILVPTFHFLICVSFLLNWKVIGAMVPGLLVSRSIFAIGISGLRALVKPLLKQVIFSSLELTKFHEYKQRLSRYWALNELSANFGYLIFLPVIYFLSSSPVDYRRLNLILAINAFLLVLNRYYTLYNVEPHEVESETQQEGSLYQLQDGLSIVKSNRNALFLCILQSTITSIKALVMLVPLLPIHFLNNTGECTSRSLLKDDCVGHLFAASVITVAQLGGYVVTQGLEWKGGLDDKKRLFVYPILLLVGALVLACLNNDNPQNMVTFSCVTMIAISRFGFIELGNHFREKLREDVQQWDVEAVQAVAGICGKISAIVFSFLGGWWSDSWMYGPFVMITVFSAIVGVLNMLLKVSSAETSKDLEQGDIKKEKYENDENK